MTSPEPIDTSKALLETLISPNEVDSNLEPANVVDGLFAIARAIEHLADATRTTAPGVHKPAPDPDCQPRTDWSVS
jgi:hypothetical protein